MAEPGYSTAQVADAVGITFARLHHWTHAGRLTPSVQPAHGSGTRIRWSPADLDLVRRVVQLEQLGLTLDAAFRYARQGIDLNALSETLQAGAQ